MPVPNTMGGAVEALDTMLIDQNRKEDLYDFTVYTCFEKTAYEKARTLESHGTHFRFIHTPRVIQAIDRAVYRISTNLLHKTHAMSYRYIFQRLWYIRKVSKSLAKEEQPFDFVMLENHATLFHIVKNKKNAIKYKDKVLYHLHNEVSADYGCIAQIHEAHKVLGVSDYILSTLNNFFEEHGLNPLEPSQQATWRNCVYTDKFDISLSRDEYQSIRKSYGISQNDIVFLFSGRLTQEKGAHELLKAFADVAQRNDNVHLIIAGSFFFNTGMSTPFEEKLKDLVQSNTLDGKVTFTGFVHYDDMPRLYAIADACVLPSLWEDPAPLAVIESMAAGKPIITTYSGGIPEYVDNHCAIILERDKNLASALAAAMEHLASDPEARMKMSQASLERGSLLNPQHYLHQFADIVQ